MEAGEFSIKSRQSYLFSSRDPGKVAIQPPTPVNRNNLVVITAILVILQSSEGFCIASVITIGKVKCNSNYRFQKLVTSKTKESCLQFLHLFFQEKFHASSP